MSDSVPGNELVEAWVLHARKYRDTSLIVEFLTRDYGRVAAVVRGVRRQKSKTAGYVQPFSRMLVSFFGHGELKTVKAMDFPFPSPTLHGNTLLMGMYVNELLVRLLGKYDAAPEVFDAYGPLLDCISEEYRANAALRQFEFLLLRELGYGVTFEWEANTGEPIEAGGTYRYVPDEGFHRVAEAAADTHAYKYTYKGEQLLAIAGGGFDDPGIDNCAKRIVRSSLSALLGGYRLKSRDLFIRRRDST